MPLGKCNKYNSDLEYQESALSCVKKMHKLRTSRADSVEDPPKTHSSDFD